MANTNIPDEVFVLRFFETGSQEKAEAVFNIVAEKMRQRGIARESLDAPALPPRGRRKGTPPREQPDEKTAATPASHAGGRPPATDT